MLLSTLLSHWTTLVLSIAWSAAKKSELPAPKTHKRACKSVIIKGQQIAAWHYFFFVSWFYYFGHNIKPKLLNWIIHSFISVKKKIVSVSYEQCDCVCSKLHGYLFKGHSVGPWSICASSCNFKFRPSFFFKSVKISDESRKFKLALSFSVEFSVFS